MLLRQSKSSNLNIIVLNEIFQSVDITNLNTSDTDTNQLWIGIKKADYFKASFFKIVIGKSLS